MGLSSEAIAKQDLQELEESLDRINELAAHPDQLGVFRAKYDATLGFVVPRLVQEAQVESGALPILLVRKAEILDRIKLLRPSGQIEIFRKEVAVRVEDEATRQNLLRLLDDLDAKERKSSADLELQSDQVQSAIEANQQQSTHAVELAKLQVGLEALKESFLEKTTKLGSDLGKVEEKSVSKWDVVTVVFATLAAMGGLVAVALGIAKWLAGG